MVCSILSHIEYQYGPLFLWVFSLVWVFPGAWRKTGVREHFEGIFSAASQERRARIPLLTRYGASAGLARHILSTEGPSREINMESSALPWLRTYCRVSRSSQKPPQVHQESATQKSELFTIFSNPYAIDLLNHLSAFLSLHCSLKDTLPSQSSTYLAFSQISSFQHTHHCLRYLVVIRRLVPFSSSLHFDTGLNRKKLVRRWRCRVREVIDMVSLNSMRRLEWHGRPLGGENTFPILPS